MGTAALIASLLAGIVQGVPQISSEIKSIVLAISTGLSALLSSGVTTSLNPQTVLAALAGVIVSIKAIPGLPADKLQVIIDLETATAFALSADQVAQQSVDPTKLLPIAPVA